MDIRSALLSEHSLAQAKKVAELAASNNNALKQLIQIFLTGDAVETQRAAWAIGHFAEAHPTAMPKYLAALIERCEQPGLPDAAKRNVSRILQFVEIPDEVSELALNCCFSWLEDPKETIATRCFSMSVLEKLSEKEPELREALAQLLEHILNYEDCSPGIKSRSSRVLRQIQKQKKKRL